MSFMQAFSLAETTTIYFPGGDEVIFRKGIWNHEEAILDVSIFEDDTKDAFTKVFTRLATGDQVDPAALNSELGVQAEDADKLLSLLDELAEQDFLNRGEDVESGAVLMRALVGGSSIGLDRATPSVGADALLITDTDLIQASLTQTATAMGLKVKELTADEFQQIESADLTSRTESLGHDAAMADLLPIVEGFSSVLVVLQRPRVRFLRNLNRLLLDQSIPMLVSLLDGPFITTMTIKAPETGCFECFENRVIARLQDISAYRRFVAAEDPKQHAIVGEAYAPILLSSALMALQDAFLISKIHKAKLAGRVFNVFVPMLEVQLQDLQRVPYCSACGYIANGKFEEMYTSSNQIVEQLLSRVQIVKGDA